MSPGDRPSGRLKTWKEIAAHFGRDERTVKRWEAQRGLPVHRMPGGGGATVYALVEEVDAWMRGVGPASSLPARAPSEVAVASAPAPAAVADGEGGRARSTRRVPIGWAAAAGVAGLAALGALWAAAAHPAKAVSPARLQAQALYSEGLYAWNTRTEAGLKEAQDDFTQAVVRDPTYAQAFAGLADVYNLSPEFGALAPERAFPRARAAAERAVQLDDGLAAAHRSLAFVDFWWFRRTKEAEREFRRAIQIDPGSAQTHHWFSNMLSSMGRYAEAVKESDLAVSLDPASTAARADRGLLLADSGHADDAVAALREIEIAAPDFRPVHRYLIDAYMLQGDLSGAAREWAALAALEPDPATRALAEDARVALAAGDVRAMLGTQLVTARRLHGRGELSPSALARYAMAAGDRRGALDALQEAVARPDVTLVAVGSEPRFAPLHGDAAFASIVRRTQAPLGS